MAAATDASDGGGRRIATSTGWTMGAAPAATEPDPRRGGPASPPTTDLEAALMSSSALEQQGHLVCDAVPLPRETGSTIVARAERTDTYSVRVVRSLPETLVCLGELLNGAKVALVTDETVLRMHGGPLIDGLREAGTDVQVASLPAGEASKSLRHATRLWDWLANSAIARRDVLLAFGGGVINDTGGWVASAYMRGVPYINVPTTLLAQVDGALGGKVAVNHEVAKNLLGAFYQPHGVVSNVAYLHTVSDRHLRAGLAEAIKKAVIASPEYWDFIEENVERIMARDLDALERLVHCAIAIKTALIERDPYEVDLRRPLNFGHTIGHPLETVTGYGPLLHGEAVAVGMVVESRIAARRGMLAEATLDRIVALLRRAGLPTTAADLPARIPATAVIVAMDKVRLIRAGSLRYVLPVALGETVIADDVTDAEALTALGDAGFDAA
jgi:3-dehydroquinate synthase